jgi:very-short-patch-repair endonuclease
MKGQTNPRVLDGKLQRVLRRHMTDAERLLWQSLRSKQTGVKFRRQHPFGDYILDFVSMDAGLVVEVDGGQHAANRDADQMRTRALEEAGFRVLRFWNHEVLKELDAVKDAIYRALQPHPHPSLPPEGEGVATEPL